MGEWQDKAEGKAKDVTGAVTGDDSMQAEGKTQQAVGGVKGKVDDAMDKVGDTITGDNHDDSDHSH